MERRRGPDRRRVPRGGRRATDRPGRHPPVLVADSYDGARRPLVRYLDCLHFDVAEAANGEEALARIVATTPYVILTEWSLPIMPAPRLTHWLAQSWHTRHIPVIVVANAEEPDITLGVSGILVKPFSLETMLKEIRRVLRASAVKS